MDTLPRDLLAKALGGNPRVVAAFENLASTVDDTATAASDNAQATQALQDASFITLAPNSTLNCERVLKRGNGISTSDDGNYLTIKVSDEVPHVQGGFPIYITALGATNIVFPLSGFLVNRDNTETLSNKTLAAPKITGLGDYVDDAAAAAGGVPVNGIYETAGVLKRRRT